MVDDIARETGHLSSAQGGRRGRCGPSGTWSKSTRLIWSAPLRRAPSPTRLSSCGRLASVSAGDCGPSRPAASPSLTRALCAIHDPAGAPGDMPIAALRSAAV